MAADFVYHSGTDMAERHFLADTVGSKPTFSEEPWYNQDGDCLVYKMANEASVADRIDELLTIYRSAEDTRKSSSATASSRAWARSRNMLFKAGDAAAIDEACGRSPIGKILPDDLYVHRSALDALEPILRIYEGCGRAYLGEIEEANLIKIHRRSGKISYLVYPDFATDPHPALCVASGSTYARGNWTATITPRRRTRPSCTAKRRFSARNIRSTQSLPG